MRYNSREKILYKTEQTEKEDEGKTEQEVTMELLAEIASSQYTWLQFTHEVAKDNNWLPVLDMQLCVGKSTSDGPWFKYDETETELAPGREKDANETRTQIEFIFYKKPMSNRISILRRSALPEATKVSTMVAEIHRRWKNTWEGASTSAFEEITKLFMDDPSSMGYTEQWRR